ncbi:Dyp-type peroxidase [Undibacterium sp. Ren11W]|uniref:Dyp-type peroxidase n=1 Tax=Undibacterium sp. Ren11W TaxID=3413045 RepID=UPI003BEF98EA
MLPFQPGILQALPQHASFLTFTLKPAADQTSAISALKALSVLVDGERVVLALGSSLLQLLGQQIAGVHDFAGISGSLVPLPATPAALWCWCRESERGELAHQIRRLIQAAAGAFQLQQAVDAFKYDSGRDLSGYEDGTENPEADAALAAALVQGQGAGLDGASYVAVQNWLHDFDRLEALSGAQQDDLIGRHKSDNAEFDEAPASAHVKRTAQESFSPEAFVLRRSMPWSAQDKAGFHFVAFATSFYAFEAQLRRMCGAEDGIVDGLFSFTKPLSGAYFWCPPMCEGRPDLSRIGL